MLTPARGPFQTVDWQMYVDSDPDDAQVAQIQGMIDTIKD